MEMFDDGAWLDELEALREGMWTPSRTSRYREEEFARMDELAAQLLRAAASGSDRDLSERVGLVCSTILDAQSGILLFTIADQVFSGHPMPHLRQAISSIPRRGADEEIWQAALPVHGWTSGEQGELELVHAVAARGHAGALVMLARRHSHGKALSVRAADDQRRLIQAAERDQRALAADMIETWAGSIEELLDACCDLRQGRGGRDINVNPGVQRWSQVKKRVLGEIAETSRTP